MTFASKPGPPSNWASDLWEYRELTRNLVARDLHVQFRGLSLSLWLSALQPLVVVLVYLFGLRTVLRIPVENYPLFLAAGFLHWHLFSSVTLRSCKAVLGNANLVSKARFPLVVLPLSSLLSELLVFGLSSLIFWLLFPFLGGKIWIGLLLYPLVLTLNLVLLMGVTLLGSSLQVFFEDYQDILSLVVRFMFWFSPVIYSFRMVPAWLKSALFCLNPMVSYLDCYRNLLYYHKSPSLFHWGIMVFWALLSLAIGWRVFSRLSSSFADEL